MTNKYKELTNHYNDMDELINKLIQGDINTTSLNRGVTLMQENYLNAVMELQSFNRGVKETYIKFKDFDTIESIERLREKVVSISDKYKNDFLNDSKLPWPGFFINKNLGKSDLVLLGFNFSQNFTFCEVSNLTDFPIPYNDKFFSYQNNQLILINDNLTV